MNETTPSPLGSGESPKARPPASDGDAPLWKRPAYLEQLRPEMLRVITTLLDHLQGQRQIRLPAASDDDL
jgi:hypothetical protein